MENKTVVHYTKSFFPEYSCHLYWFYSHVGNNIWVWDEYKLTIEDALLSYPQDKYEWVEMEDE